MNNLGLAGENVSLKESMAGLLGGRELPPFPESFLFGVATADHQC
jgi:hypothetical protein